MLSIMNIFNRSKKSKAADRPLEVTEAQRLLHKQIIGTTGKGTMVRYNDLSRIVAETNKGGE